MRRLLSGVADVDALLDIDAVVEESDDAHGFFGIARACARGNPRAAAWPATRSAIARRAGFGEEGVDRDGAADLVAVQHDQGLVAREQLRVGRRDRGCGAR